MDAPFRTWGELINVPSRVCGWTQYTSNRAPDSLWMTIDRDVDLLVTGACCLFASAPVIMNMVAKVQKNNIRKKRDRLMAAKEAELREIRDEDGAILVAK